MTTTDNARLDYRWLMMIMVVLATLAFLWTPRADYAHVTLQSPTQDPPVTPMLRTPMYTPQDAVSKSLLYFPESFTVITTVVRLTNYSGMDAWSGYSHPLSTVSPSAPVWIVGIVANDMVIADAIPILAPK